MNFHLGVGFKIAGEQDTKQWNMMEHDFQNNCSSHREKAFLLS